MATKKKKEIVGPPQRPDAIGNRPIVKDMTQPYVLAGGYSAGLQRILMGTTDDIEVEVDPRTYEIMENDATIIKSKRILITGTLADDMQLAPGATEDEVGHDEYEVYVEIMEFCERTINGLDRPYRETLEQLLGNGIRYGHGIAETVWEYRLDGSSTKPKEKLPEAPTTKIGSMLARFGHYMGLGRETIEAKESTGVISRPTLRSEKTRLMPKMIRVKPRNSARFVVDDFMNVLGLVPRYKTGTNLAWDSIIDRQKFLVLTMNKQDEDPRGKSCYRQAFNWYNLKVQLPAEMLRLVLEEIVPKAVATMPEKAQPFEIARDHEGNVIWENPEKTIPKMVTPVESMKNIIENFRGGSGAVIPHDATLQPFKSGSTGTDADLAAKIIKIIDDQIENSILGQTLAQSEGAHQARSAAQQVAEILNNFIFWNKWLLGQMTLIDLFEVAVRINFGEWAVRYLPQVSLGDFVRRDWGSDLEKLSDAYFKGFIDDTQRAELMAWLNLPRPGPSRAEMTANQTQQTGAQQDVNGEPIQPNNNRPDKQTGNTNRNKGNGTEKKKNAKTTNNQSSDGFSLGNLLGHHKRGSGFISRYLLSGRK